MKQYSECFGTNFTTKSPSTRSWVQKLIADGRRVEHNRQVSEKIIKSHAAHECMRNGLISASGGSVQIRSENKCEDHAVLNTHLFGNKEVKSSHISKPCSCNKYCSPSSIIKRYLYVCQHCMSQQKVEKYIKTRRKRFGPKMCATMKRICSNPISVCSAPCLPCLCRSFLIHSSNALSTSDMNKCLLPSKSRCKHRIYENDNKSSFACSANGRFNYIYPHQFVKIKEIQNRPKEINGLPLYKNKICPSSFLNQYQNNRGIKMQNTHLVGLKSYRNNNIKFSFDNGTSVFIPRERNLRNSKRNIKASHTWKSNQNHRSISTTDILKQSTSNTNVHSKTSVFESEILNKQRKRKYVHVKSSAIYIDNVYRNMNPKNISFMRNCFGTLNPCNKHSCRKETNISIIPKVRAKARVKSKVENTYKECPKRVSSNNKQETNSTFEFYKHENLHKLKGARQKIKNDTSEIEKCTFYQEAINPLFHEFRSRIDIPRQFNSNRKKRNRYRNKYVSTVIEKRKSKISMTSIHCKSRSTQSRVKIDEKRAKSECCCQRQNFQNHCPCHVIEKNECMGRRNNRLSSQQKSKAINKTKSVGNITKRSLKKQKIRHNYAQTDNSIKLKEKHSPKEITRFRSSGHLRRVKSKTKGSVLIETPYDCKRYNSDTQGRLKNALLKLLSILADAHRREFPKVRTRAARVTRSRTVPKMPVELEKVLINPRTRRVFTVGSNINFNIEFYKDESFDVDHIASSPKKGSSWSRSMSSSPYKYQRVSLRLLKKLGSLKTLKGSNKSKKARLNKKYNKSRVDIVKKKTVKSISNNQFLENKNVITHRNNRKDKFKRNHKIDQSSHENSIKEQVPQNITSIHQFSIADNTGSNREDTKSKIQSGKNIREQTKEKQTVNSRISKNKLKYKECNKQSESNRQEPRKLQRKDDENSKNITKFPVVSTLGYDKGTLTKLKKTKITDYECKPHVCIPGKCNTKNCLNIFKNKRKTCNDISISAKQEVKSKSVSTDAYMQEMPVSKRCFCFVMNKKSTNIEIPEKNPNYSITDRGHLKKVELLTPYEKTNKQSKTKNLIRKCFTKIRLIDAGKESIIALTRKPEVYKRGQYKKNEKTELSKPHIKAKLDLKIHTHGNMETLMPYSKKKFKKSRSRMTFVGFYESKNQELITKVSTYSPKRYEYKNIKEQKDTTSKTRLNQSMRSKYKKKTKHNVSNRIEKQYSSTTEMFSIPPNTVKFATPYERLNKQSKGKHLLCKCLAKFGLYNANKESSIALKRKPAVYKRSEYQKKIKGKSSETHKKEKQDFVIHNYGNMEILMPYSKKKFKKSRSRMTFVGFYESKNQELFTKASISSPKRYKKIKEQNETTEILFSKPNRYDIYNNLKKQDFPNRAISFNQLRGKYNKRSKMKVLNKIDEHFIAKTEMPISRHNGHKHKKTNKKNINVSKISLCQPPGQYKKGLKQSIRNKIEKEYLPTTGMPISPSKSRKYKKIKKQNATVSDHLFERKNVSKYKKRQQKDVTGNDIFVSPLSTRKQTKKKKEDKVATKVIINRVALSDIAPSPQSRSKYENRNENYHLKSVNTSNRRQKSKIRLKMRDHNFFENNMDTFRVSQYFPVASKLSKTPVISKCLNGIAKCLKTAIFNLPLGFLKKNNRLQSYHYRNLKADETVLTGQRLSKKYKYEEIVKQNSQRPHSLMSTVTRSTCLCPQNNFDNSECFKTTDKKNSAFNEGVSYNNSGNSSKHLDNHFKLITFRNGKCTQLQTRTIQQTKQIPLADVRLSENIKILKSYPCCGRDHNQPELSISGPKSVPGFFKCLYRKKSKPTHQSCYVKTKQDCPMCLKNTLLEVPPADFCSKKCSISFTPNKFESERTIRKQKKIKTEVDKVCPLFGVVVDAHTMKVTNKDEVYRNLKANSQSDAKKKDLEKSKIKQAVSPAIDLFINRDDAMFVNGDYMLRALDTNRKKMNTSLNMKINTKHTISQPCCRHVLMVKQPIKVVKSEEQKSHHEYCTCCICSNSREMRSQNHPRNCTCCICRYNCRFGVRSRTKQQKNEINSKVEETNVKKQPGRKKYNKNLQLCKKKTRNDKLYETASQISSLVRNIRKVSSHVTGFAAKIEKFFSQLRVKPCFCGLRMCKKETRKLQELRLRNLKLNAPPECVCGSKVCKLKHTKRTPYYKAKAKRKKKKAIEKKRRNEQFRQEAIARIKQYSKEDASMRKRMKRQDKKAMKTVEKYEDDTSSWVLLAENAADVGQFTINTTNRMITGVKRVISHPRDIKYRAMLAYSDPKGSAAKSLQEFRDSGYSGTLARVRRRFASMQASKYLISAMDSHPVTKYLLHYRDKDPKKRFLKPKPRKEKRDIECNTFFTSLRKKPCLWLYRLCPGFYPHCLSLLTFWRQFTDIFIFLLAVAVWSPCILCTEFCRAVVCCLMCAGGV